MASFSGGNVSLRRLNAAGTAARPTPWIILLANRNDMLFENTPAVIPVHIESIVQVILSFYHRGQTFYRLLESLRLQQSDMS